MSLTGNRISNPLVYRSALNPLSHTNQGCLFIFNTRPRTVKALFFQKNQVDRLSLTRKVCIGISTAYIAPGLGSAQQWEYTLIGLWGGAASAWPGDQAQARQVRTQPWTGNRPHNGMGLKGSGTLFPMEGAGSGQHTPVVGQSCQSLFLWVSTVHPAV